MNLDPADHLTAKNYKERIGKELRKMAIVQNDHLTGEHHAAFRRFFAVFGGMGCTGAQLDPSEGRAPRGPDRQFGTRVTRPSDACCLSGAIGMAGRDPVGGTQRLVWLSSSNHSDPSQLRNPYIPPKTAKNRSIAPRFVPFSRLRSWQLHAKFSAPSVPACCRATT